MVPSSKDRENGTTGLHLFQRRVSGPIHIKVSYLWGGGEGAFGDGERIEELATAAESEACVDIGHHTASRGQDGLETNQVQPQGGRHAHADEHACGGWGGGRGPRSRKGERSLDKAVQYG